MSKFQNRALILACSVTLWLSATSQLIAEKLTGSAQSSELQQVLIDETRQPIDPSALLSDLRSLSSASDSSHWQSGQIKIDDRWLDYQTAVSELQFSTLFEEYNKRRALVGSNGKKHLQLANWCRRNQMKDQERAHLFAAAETAREFRTPAIMQRLGYVPHDGTWLSPERQRLIEQQSTEVVESLKLYGKRLVEIRNGLAASGTQRDRAEAELKKIRSPTAVAAIDLVLGHAGPREAEYAIHTLKEIDSYQATQSIANHAIFSGNRRIRNLAIQSLKGRRFEHFVPQLMRLLVTEHEREFYMTTVPSFRGNPFGLPDLLIGVKTKRETDTEIQVADFGTQLSLKPFLPAPVQRRDTKILIRQRDWNDIMRSIERRLYTRVSRTESVDRQTADMNQKVVDVLSQVSGKSETSSNPQVWWKWWLAYADVDAAEKRVVEVSEFNSDELEVLVLLKCSCFAAGTAVWTTNGLKPIETVQVGDLVLSKNSESSELEFKPVLKTTIRPSRMLVNVNFGTQNNRELITATGGHQFWKAGKGWVKARDLQQGDFIHTSVGNVQVESVQTGPTLPTHNLVVADFHTYFVGKSGMLVQDLLPPEPTNKVVPGLLRWEITQSSENQ